MTKNILITTLSNMNYLIFIKLLLMHNICIIIKLGRYKRRCDVHPGCISTWSSSQFKSDCLSPFPSSPPHTRIAMSSIDVEAAILSALINEHKLCFVCLDPVLCIDDVNSPLHPVTPFDIQRSDGCGHLVHRDCSKDLLRHAARILETVTKEGTVLNFGFHCFCSKFVRQFTTADISLGKFKYIYYYLLYS